MQLHMMQTQHQLNIPHSIVHIYIYIYIYILPLSWESFARQRYKTTSPKANSQFTNEKPYTE